MRTPENHHSRLWGVAIGALLLAVMGLALLTVITWGHILFLPQNTPATLSPTSPRVTTQPSRAPLSFTPLITVQPAMPAPTFLQPSAATTSTIPAVPPQNWQTLSQIYFRGPTELQYEWEGLNAVRFETYQLLISGLFEFKSPTKVDFLITGNSKQDLKIGLAYSDTPTASVSLMCKYQNEKPYPVLTLNADTLELVSVQSQTQKTLTQRAANKPLSQGEWSWIRLNCAQDQVVVWQDDEMIFQERFNLPDNGGMSVQFSPGLIRLYSFQALFLQE